MTADAQTAQSQQLVVDARGLTKVFKDFWGRPKAKAVNGIDFSVPNGTVFGLLGPNGSGKSTTLKMLLGLLYPTRGQLTVLGESPEHVDTKRRIGYLPEDSYLYPYLTAAESLDFFGALFGLPPAEREKRCRQLLQMVGLTSARNRPVGEFSKGMARRIGMAQALVNDPELVILDEPTAGLDPIGCREVKDVIRLLAERGKTIILCSHLLADVEDVCDDLIVLYGGKVCARGGLRDLLKIEDKTRIQIPRLEPQHFQQLMAALREHVNEEEIDVDQPSMNLEQLFLEVVRKARESSLETAGAESGGGIAAYLKEGVPEESESARRRRELLETLAAAQEKEASASGRMSAEEQVKEKRQPARAEAAEERLEALSSEHGDATGEGAYQEGEGATRENAVQKEREASRRLKNLLKNEDEGEDNGHG